MKRLLLSLVTFLSLGALAGPYAILQNQRNAADSGTINRITAPPTAPLDGIYWYDGANQIPDMLLLGTNLTISSGTLNAAPQVQSDWLAGSGLAVILNKPTAVSAFTNDVAYINQAGARTAVSLTTTGSGAASYNNSTGILNVPTPAASSPSQSSASRSLNTAFQVSSTRNALVVYAVQITVTASIAGGQDGDVILEIASDSGFTTNVQTLSKQTSSQTYSLAVALQGVQKATSPLFGFVPAGYYSRLRTVSNTGSPSFLFFTGQEILL